MNLTSLLEIPVKLYMKKIYPFVKNKRGAYRVSVFLENMAKPSFSFKGTETSIKDFRASWDNLIILDACRQDTFEKVTGLDGSRISRGSATKEFIKENFSSGDFSDTIYVTGNPHFDSGKFEQYTGRKPENVFHQIFNTYNTDWDDEAGVVLPSAIRRDVETARKLYPNKKIIAHFMQPHTPFIQSDVEQSPNDEVDKDSQIIPELEKAEREGFFVERKL